MKKWIKAALSGLVAAALTVGMLGGLSGLMEQKYARIKHKPFFEQENDFDVLVLGTSHAMLGVFPMELWEDYGIVSYNLSCMAITLPITYWVMVNALDYTDPDLIVIDCNRLSWTDKVHSNVEFLNYTLDEFPLSANKLQSVFDLTSDKKWQVDLLWNFSLYHERWKEITQDDFLVSLTTEKGAESREYIAPVEKPAQIDKSRKLDEDTVAVQYLRKMIELCQKRDIDVLLTYIPYPTGETEQMEANRVTEIAEEYGVGYINYLDLDVINYRTDLSDATEHLNASGARKVTDYLGAYIREHYDVPDRRDDPDYADWYGDYEDYTAYKVRKMTEKKEINSFLLMLQDKHFSSVLYLAPHGAWSGTYKDLLSNMGVDSERLETDSPTLAVADNGAGTVLYLAPGEEADTSFGHLAFVRAEGGYQVLLDGEAQLEPTNQTMAAAVVDGATNRVAMTAQFTASTATTFTKVA